jgi:hypothetical protein
MKLCFVSENGARETYFVDAPRRLFAIKVKLSELNMIFLVYMDIVKHKKSPRKP